MSLEVELIEHLKFELNSIFPNEGSFCRVLLLRRFPNEFKINCGVFFAQKMVLRLVRFLFYYSPVFDVKKVKNGLHKLSTFNQSLTYNNGSW